MDKECLLEKIRGKRIPDSCMRVKWADLYLQEAEIVKSLRSCDTLEKVDEVLDKFVTFVAFTNNILQGFDD